MEIRSVFRLLLFFFTFLQASLSERGTRPFQSLKAPTETITNYDIIIPVIDYRSDQELHPKELWVILSTPKGNFTLQLEHNDLLIHPNFGSTYYDQNGNEIVEKGHVNCFYHGRVKEHPKWMLSMSTCHGLQGSFGDENNYFHLEPLSEVNLSLEQPHAFYLASEYSSQEGGCACNETARPRSPPPPPGSLKIRDGTALKKRLRRQVNGFLVTELVVVSDFRQFDAFGRNVTATLQRALEVINYVDLLYRVLDIRVILVGAVTWSNGDEITVVSDFVQLLNNFVLYLPEISTPSDSAMLFTGIDLDGSTIGFASVGTMCSDFNSVGLVQDTRRSVESTGGITAHELGHIFNMNHDDGRVCSCDDPAGGCIMSASLPFPFPTRWSTCSVSDLNDGFANRDLDRCLTNEPAITFGDPVCGNGIREGDEVCDCGSSEFALTCTDPCCNATTCELADGAQCHRGPCCQPSCQFTEYGTTCRGERNECDILEYCTGESSDCPADLHLQDGTSCNDNQSLCFSGTCQTYDSQCQLHYGPNSRMAVEECYSDWNVDGSIRGNCGSSSTAFIPCQESNVLCGQLHCTPGVYTNAARVRVFTNRNFVTFADRSRENCYSFSTDAGSDTPSPGLVQDGSQCGDQMLCFEQQCIAVSELSNVRPCRVESNGLVCAGNGLCNNLNLCSCNVGFTGAACQTAVNEPGGGGGGAIAGAVVGVILGLALVTAVVVVIVIFVRKRKTKYHPPTWRTSKPTTAASSRPRPSPARNPTREQVPAAVVVNQSNGTNRVASRPPPPRPAPQRPANFDNAYFNEPPAFSTQPASFGESPQRRPPPKPPAPSSAHLPTAPPPAHPPPVRSALPVKQAATVAPRPVHTTSPEHKSFPAKRPPPPKPVMAVKPSLQHATPENQETSPSKPKPHPPPPSARPPPKPEDTKPEVFSSKPTVSTKPVIVAKPTAPPRPTLPHLQPSRSLQADSAAAPPTKPKPAAPAKRPLVPPRK